MRRRFGCEILCPYCGKGGHMELECWKKERDGNMWSFCGKKGYGEAD